MYSFYYLTKDELFDILHAIVLLNQHVLIDSLGLSRHLAIYYYISNVELILLDYFCIFAHM